MAEQPPAQSEHVWRGPGNCPVCGTTPGELHGIVEAFSDKPAQSTPDANAAGSTEGVEKEARRLAIEEDAYSMGHSELVSVYVRTRLALSDAEAQRRRLEKAEQERDELFDTLNEQNRLDFVGALEAAEAKLREYEEALGDLCSGTEELIALAPAEWDGGDKGYLVDGVAATVEKARALTRSNGEEGTAKGRPTLS